MIILQNKLELRNNHICDFEVAELATFNVSSNVDNIQEFQGTLTAVMRFRYHGVIHPSPGESEPSLCERIFCCGGGSISSDVKENIPLIEGPAANGQRYFNKTFRFKIQIRKEEIQQVPNFIQMCKNLEVYEATDYITRSFYVKDRYCSVVHRYLFYAISLKRTTIR